MNEEQNCTAPTRKDGKIKCVIWDLDNTLWNGTLLEGQELAARMDVVSIIRTLDERGILQSIASKNDHAMAIGQLEAFKLSEFFLYPQIHWKSKSESVQTIADYLGIGLDTMAFVDDQAFERDEVRHYHPEVLTIDAAEVSSLLELPCMYPRFVTKESRLRRKMYQADVVRKQDEASFGGARVEFLATLNMRITIRHATAEDLQRAEELTIRTNQMNTTGLSYSYEQLSTFVSSPVHDLLVVELEDRYGPSGIVGLALLQKTPKIWKINLFIMSCRVISRGVGSIFMTYLCRSARECNVTLQAAFRPTDRNRMMYATFKFQGFSEVGEQDGIISLAHATSSDSSYPEYAEIHHPECLAS